MSPSAGRTRPNWRARDAAEEASRAKTEFLANMSHELRTPLNAVIGFADILSGELFGKLSEARYREYARLIHESGKHLLNVVNDILDMSKVEAGKFRLVKEPVDVGALVALSCDIMRHAAEQRSLVLIADVVPGLPALAADRRTCKQMLLNLIANAINSPTRAASCASRRARPKATSNSASPITALASPSRTCPSSAIRSCKPIMLAAAPGTGPGSDFRS